MTLRTTEMRAHTHGRVRRHRTACMGVRRHHVRRVDKGGELFVVLDKDLELNVQPKVVVQREHARVVGTRLWGKTARACGLDSLSNAELGAGG